MSVGRREGDSCNSRKGSVRLRIEHTLPSSLAPSSVPCVCLTLASPLSRAFTPIPTGVNTCPLGRPPASSCAHTIAEDVLSLLKVQGSLPLPFLLPLLFPSPSHRMLALFRTNQTKTTTPINKTGSWSPHPRGCKPCLSFPRSLPPPH